MEKFNEINTESQNSAKTMKAGRFLNGTSA